MARTFITDLFVVDHLIRISVLLQQDSHSLDSDPRLHPSMVQAPMGEKTTNLVKRDVHGRVRHAWAREAKVVNCDPMHCKGVWKPPPEKSVNRSSGQVLAGAIQRARRKHAELPREEAPGLVGKAHKVGPAHQTFVREMRELERKKLGEPRPATVPAMNVPQAFHVQRFFDRAAHHGEAAVGMRTRRAEADKFDPRQPFARTQRLGHTQHRTEVDIDARMDDVWGAFHMGRGLKQGQLAGSNYIEKYRGNAEVRVYVGNLSRDADMTELRETLGLNKQEIVLSDPASVPLPLLSLSLSPPLPSPSSCSLSFSPPHPSQAAAAKLFWFERPRNSNFCLLVTTDAKLAARVVKHCKSKPCKLRGHLLRVDFVHRGEHNMRWTEGHRPEGADWAHEHKQVDCKVIDKNWSKGSKSQAYGLMASEYKRSFSAGLLYDINGIDRFLKQHPAGSMAYPSVAEGRRRGAPQHGLMQWYPWMPAWEKGAPLKRMEWIPTPSFPGGGEVDMPMNKERMRLKYRYPDDLEAGK